ncbi:hypothetical protein, partial [Cyclobacterium amurskyense]
MGEILSALLKKKYNNTAKIILLSSFLPGPSPLNTKNYTLKSYLNPKYAIDILLHAEIALKS